MRYIIIESTKFIGKFSIYDTVLEVETACHNYATAKSLCAQWNKDTSVCESCICEACECDPCDCHGSQDQ
jgi:hypothetical protein